MDSELSTKISGVVKQLAQQQRQRLRAAGTFVEMEELACEIGDEVTRQLMAGQLAERSHEVADAFDNPSSRKSTLRRTCLAQNAA